MKKMFKVIYFIFGFSSIFPAKILHISFHEGCINDVRQLAFELNLDVTSCMVQNHPEFFQGKFDGATRDNGIYNITHERAERVWQLHKDFFNSFDAIITSDTAPLSRIFLQNNWTKPLIIWVCNRFDYADGATARNQFPDSEYYQMIQSAVHQPNVKIISYTPYEHYYARRKGVEFGQFTLRPIGKKPAELRNSGIPEHIDKPKTIFLYPRLEKHQADYILGQCINRGISTYWGNYNGPDDLTDFKGVLYFPYAWSNLALFENVLRGIVHFLPSEKFILENRLAPIRTFTMRDFQLCDWYCPEFRDLFVYFDSWEDLKRKIDTTDYVNFKPYIMQRASEHYENTIEEWKKIFERFGLL